MTLTRKMTFEDAEEASKIMCYIMYDTWKRYEKDYYPKHALEFDISRSSPKHLKENFTNPERLMLVAEHNGKIVGIASGEIIGKSGLAKLSSLGVHPAHQRQGVGKALLQEFIQHCRQEGCHKVTLNTIPVLIPAINLYLKCGFVPEAYLRREWWKVDFIKMSLWLESP